MSAQDDQQVDLRIRRTRQLLRDAFMELLAEKDFQSVTVQDIAERANVNRTTFYDHFVDKYALLEDAIRDGFQRALLDNNLQDAPFTAGNLQRLIETTCDYLFELHHQCLPKARQIFQLLQAQITTIIAGILLTWLNNCESGDAPDESARLQAAIASWSIYGAAFHWSSESQRMPLAAFAASALPIIMTTISQGRAWDSSASSNAASG